MGQTSLFECKMLLETKSQKCIRKLTVNENLCIVRAFDSIMETRSLLILFSNYHNS